MASCDPGPVATQWEQEEGLHAEQTDGWTLRGARVELKIVSGGSSLAPALKETNYDAVMPDLDWAPLLSGQRAPCTSAVDSEDCKGLKRLYSVKRVSKL